MAFEISEFLWMKLYPSGSLCARPIAQLSSFHPDPKIRRRELGLESGQASQINWQLTQCFAAQVFIAYLLFVTNSISIKTGHAQVTRPCQQALHNHNLEEWEPSSQVPWGIQIPNWDHCIWRAKINCPCNFVSIDCKSSFSWEMP